MKILRGNFATGNLDQSISMPDKSAMLILYSYVGSLKIDKFDRLIH